MLDLLLIHPGGKKQVYQSLAEQLTAIEPPLWCALLAQFPRRLGNSVQILDTNALNLSPQETAARVAELSAQLVAVVVYGHQPSASTQHMPAAGAICSAIKAINPKQKLLMVGGHVAALPERTLREEAVDFVCSGEGPKTVAELLRALQSGGKDLSAVPDLYYYEGSEIVKTAPAALIQDLDQAMPEPTWDLLPMHLYRAHNWHGFGLPSRQPYASIYTSLGCPYHCSFCCIQAPFKTGELASGFKPNVNSYRFWGADRVLATIDRLVKVYGVRHLKIADEMFILNERHVNALCEKLIERKYDLNLWAYARIDTIKFEQLPLLKRAGFNWLAIGIESASEQVRKDVAKPFHEKSVEQTIQKIQEAGIHVIANYIFGLPEDDEKSMQQTLDLALNLNTEFSNFYCAMAYPGSELYRQAISDERPLPKSWSAYSQHSRDSFPLRTKTLSPFEVLDFRDQAFQTYFSRPEYQSMMAERFGESARDEIRAMLEIPMIRSHRETADLK